MEAAQARLSLHLSKYHIVGNHMSRSLCLYMLPVLVILFWHSKREEDQLSSSILHVTVENLDGINVNWGTRLFFIT